MKKIIFTLILLLSTLSAEVEWIGYEEALIKAKSEDKKIMLMIARNTCSVCTYMTKVVLKDKNVLKKLTPNFISVYIELDFDDIPEGLTYIGVPTFYFLDKNANVLLNIDGGKTIPSFLQTLDELNN